MRENKTITDESYEEAMIEEILKHLDGELEKGAGRMSVIIDENAKEAKSYSSKCCNSYGRPSTETIGLLDMYTDIGSEKYDRE